MRTASYLYLALYVTVTTCAVLPKNYTIQKFLNNPSIQKFRQYIQIDTSKEENINVAVDFWRKQAADLNLPFAVHRPAGKPICVITWLGSDPARPSIMLNSHMDVVPVEEEFWKYPPFSAHIDENGDIYGRGTQDDKDVAIQYIEAIRRLKENNVTLSRTLHVTLMPDEETGGFKGMEEFVKTKEFKELNVGMALDEGATSPDDTMFFTYVDKRPWQMKITVQGKGGHGATVTEGTAIQKLTKILNEIEKYRQVQKKIMSRDPTDNGAYDSLNVNIVHGDVEGRPNVIPGKMYLVVDARLAVDRDVEEMQKLIDSWVAIGGNGTKVEYDRKVKKSVAVQLDKSEYWTAIQEWAQDINLSIKPVVTPASTDMIPLRALGIPAFGFAAKTHTPLLMHGSNEHLNAATLLRGIDVYVTLLKKLGNL